MCNGFLKTGLLVLSRAKFISFILFDALAIEPSSMPTWNIAVLGSQ